MSARLTQFLFKYLSAALVLSFAAVFVQAQKPKPSPTQTPADDPQGTVKIPIRRVRLPITVTDKKGNFVPGLTKEDFVVLEDHTALHRSVDGHVAIHSRQAEVSAGVGDEFHPYGCEAAQGPSALRNLR